MWANCHMDNCFYFGHKLGSLCVGWSSLLHWAYDIITDFGIIPILLFYFSNIDTYHNILFH